MCGGGKVRGLRGRVGCMLRKRGWRRRFFWGGAVGVVRLVWNIFFGGKALGGVGMGGGGLV